MMDRRTVEKQSVLAQYEQAAGLFRTYYQIEKIEGMERTKVELVPEKVFRETVANALVHRLWDIDAHIRIEMYSDRISVTSPGPLPTGIRRIRSAYKDAAAKASFHLSKNAIQVILPVISAKEPLSSAEQAIIAALSENLLLSSSELSSRTGFSRDKVIRLVSSLSEKGAVQTTGNGRGTKYGLRK